MKCPYPDCQGDVSEGEQFCGECGRSLAPEAVAAAKAGMATNPLTTTSLPPPPLTTQPMPPVVPPPPPMTPVMVAPVTAPAARSNNLLPWIVIGVLGIAAITVLCCLGFAYIGATVQGTPTVPPARSSGVVFALTELTATNNFRVDNDVVTADGRKIGALAIRTGYNYEGQGSPEWITTVEILVNDTQALELAATNEPKYTETNAEFEVARAGQTYTRTTEDNLKLTVTVERVAILENPPLANASAGKQPAFTDLALTIDLTTP